MRRGVLGIWIGLLVLALTSATLRFALVAVENPLLAPGELALNYVVVMLVIVATWTLVLRFVEWRQRRQAAAVQARFPGSMTFPSLPTPELVDGVRSLDAGVELDAVDALTVLVDPSGVALRHRGADTTALLLTIDRASVLDVTAGSAGSARHPRPALVVLVSTDGGLLPLAFPAFRPARPFRRTSTVELAALVVAVRAALDGI